jgi:hypothetical protein
MQKERTVAKKMNGDLVKCLHTETGNVPVHVMKTYEQMDV